VRDRLIRATVDLLADEGPSEIKVRRIADAAGTTTIAIYHHFGGVQELLDHVIGHGFATLGVTFSAATESSDDPGAQLFAIALSARAAAQENAHLYDLMFGLSTRGTYRYVGETAPGGVVAHFHDAFAVFAGACESLASSGRVDVTDGSRIARQLWSAAHGFILLEAAGQFRDLTDPVEDVLLPMMVDQFVGMGDERDRAVRSARDAIAWWAAR